MGQRPSSAAVFAAVVSATPEAARLDTMASAYLDALPPRHRAALVAYTGALSRVVNPWLTGPGDVLLAPDERRLVEQHVVSLVAAVANSPGLGGMPAGTRLAVFTGFPASAVSDDPDFGRSAANPSSLQVGAPVGWLRNRLVSTSLSYAVSQQFAANDFCCVFRLELVPPMAALPLWRISRFPDEFEVLLPPGYRWRVAARDDSVQPVLITVVCENPDAYADHARVRRVLLELQEAATRGYTRRSGEVVDQWHRDRATADIDIGTFSVRPRRRSVRAQGRSVGCPRRCPFLHG